MKIEDLDQVKKLIEERQKLAGRCVFQLGIFVAGPQLHFNLIVAIDPQRFCLFG
jgi:hypothetical protein